MKLSDDSILQADVDGLVKDYPELWNELGGASVLVTGATGHIGTQLVLALLNANAEYKLDMTVYAVVRNREKAEKLFKYADKSVLKLVVQDIQSPFVSEEDIDYIIHGASVTSSKDFVDYPVETIMTAINGTKNVLELAKQKHIKGMVYLSSLEVYGIADLGGQPVKEDTFGPIDCMSVRSSYSEGKKLVECLCASYASEYGVAVKVVRLTQTFGPGVDYSDNRVFAQFARSIIEGKDIVLKTDGSTERSYCYTKDAVSAILTVLIRGKNGEAYNAANKNTAISIRDMAQLLVDKYPQSGSKLVFDIADDASKLGYNPKIRICLDTEKIEGLGWKASADLPEMFDHLIESMKTHTEG